MEAETKLVCEGCGRRVESCAFCDEGDCGDPICYRCLMVELRETVTQPHEHGG
jgi:hypothetical protein